MRDGSFGVFKALHRFLEICFRFRSFKCSDFLKHLRGVCYKLHLFVFLESFIMRIICYFIFWDNSFILLPVVYIIVTRNYEVTVFLNARTRNIQINKMRSTASYKRKEKKKKIAEHIRARKAFRWRYQKSLASASIDILAPPPWRPLMSNLR